MTMILALPGSGEVVVAADTLVCASYDEAFYTSSTEKIWKEGRWFIGVAGHEAGKSVLENIRREGFSFDRDLGSVAYVLAQKVYDIFALRRYRSAPTAITIKAQPTILLSDLFL
jgi:ATP-dependent protease HslVU (ClpYQ) peptidase subunit